MNSSMQPLRQSCAPSIPSAKPLSLTQGRAEETLSSQSILHIRPAAASRLHSQVRPSWWAIACSYPNEESSFLQRLVEVTSELKFMWLATVKLLAGFRSPIVFDPKPNGPSNFWFTWECGS